MSRLYLDASCIIYLVEAVSPFHAAVVARVMAHRSQPGADLITSRLSRLECRTRPLREANKPLLSIYDSFFSSTGLHLGEVTTTVIERATELRARHGLKTPDAIHLSTAIEQGVAAFLTGDRALARCGEISVEVLMP